MNAVFLQMLLDARNNEYNNVSFLCARFLAQAAQLVQLQSWNEQVHREFAEVLEKVHVLFRSAKRHDMLGTLTATRRAFAAEALAICEQVFRVLVDKDYAKARRLLELHSDLYCDTSNANMMNEEGEPSNEIKIDDPPD